MTHQPQEQGGGSTKVPAVRAKSRDARRGGTPTRAQLGPLREDLMNVAYQQQTFGQFCDSYLPKGYLIPNGGLQILASCSWMDTILHLATTNTTLRQALSAISLSSLGNRQGDDTKIRQGAECYGAAVIRLNQALQSEAVLKDEAVVPTCQLLSYYEVGHMRKALRI